MKDGLIVRFLYQTVPGRMFLKLLTQPGISRAAGRFLSSGFSKWLVPCYIRRHKIDMHDIIIPAEGFASFNAFFIRKRKTAPSDLPCGRLISPCDGLLTAVKIKNDTTFDIKKTRCTLEDLLQNPVLAAKFEGGTALIFRLTPAHYHRYCYAADGVVYGFRRIPGKLHCVRPVALRTVPVYTQNSREYQVLRTRRFGTVVQMEIGALLVGKINNRRLSPANRRVQAAEEKGYFEFGGSTIVLLLQKDAIRLQKRLCEELHRGGEIPVRMGEIIAY